MTCLLLSISTRAPAKESASLPASSHCLKPTFAEEFNTPKTLSRIIRDWKTQYVWGNRKTINNELQYYLQPKKEAASAFRIQDGKLIIEARPSTPKQRKTLTMGRRYTSGLLTSEKLFTQRYGRFEIRARLPKGRGLWPAFWLLPAIDHWPKGVDILPEIDVMEFLGQAVNSYHVTVHSNQSGSLQSESTQVETGQDLSSGFHRYAVEWDKREIRWYFNGKQVAHKATPRDLHQPMYLLLNLAVGGNWPGSPDRQTPFPARFEIDWVRVHRILPTCGQSDRNSR